MASTGRQRLYRGLGGIAAAALAAFVAWQVAADREPGPVPAEAATWVDETTCQSCHPAEAQAWQGSHHHLAMQRATPATVLGDFDDQVLTTDVETTTFFRRDGATWIRTPGADGQPADHPVAFTFGIEPLQQYLLALPDGRLQAHGAAWDVQAERWFHLYDGEGVDHRHRLHWTGAQQNADFMCIDCHTTGFEPGFDADEPTWSSSWHALGVGCQSCHGPASLHLRWAAGGARSEEGRGFAHALSQRGDPREVETCARCHSRRTPLGHDLLPGGELLDDYLPMILTADLYEVDGGILGEVFEWGSFTQSRMYQAGVVCTDCHDPHAAGLRVAGNAVCTQCHNRAATPIRAGIDGSGLLAKDYDDPAHHHHTTGSAGSQCTSCHMPGRVYMGNDLRHDHRFGSPHPVQARALSHADACLGCHGDEEEATVAAFERWYPSAAPRDGGYARDLHAARSGSPGAAAALLYQLARADLPDIRRATLLAELPHSPSAAAGRALAEALTHPAPLVRRTAVDLLGTLLPAPQQARLLAPLLEDPVRAVRLAAAWQLLQLPLAPGADRLALIAEYEQAQLSMLDRAESHINLAGVYEATGRHDRVEPALRRALQLDPASSPARILLAQWREQVAGDVAGALRLLQEGLDRDETEASLWHAAGLLHVRQGQRDLALQALRRAHEHAPEEADFGYVWAVALHDSGRSAEALELLRELVGLHPTHRPMRQALVGYLRAAGHHEEAEARQPGPLAAEP